MNLIYFPEDKLKPSGGPAGYLYNLKQELTKLGNKEIVFLPAEKTIISKDRLKDALPRRLVEFRKALRFTRMYTEKQTPPVDLNLYDTVHFHRTDDLYRCREALENYEGKVILTSHTPCARFQELIDMLNPTDAKLMKMHLSVQIMLFFRVKKLKNHTITLGRIMVKSRINQNMFIYQQVSIHVLHELREMK